MTETDAVQIKIEVAQDTIEALDNRLDWSYCGNF